MATSNEFKRLIFEREYELYVYNTLFENRKEGTYIIPKRTMSAYVAIITMCVQLYGHMNEKKTKEWQEVEEYIKDLDKSAIGIILRGYRD